MAFSNYQSMLINLSSQLLQQNLLTNSTFFGSSVGQNLREMVLGESPPRATTFTDPFSEAITGSIRADAGALRQNARNIGEAASMVDIAQQATETIKNKLEEAEQVLESYNAGDISEAEAEEDYNALLNDITATIKETDYNGIPLLDGDQWSSESRITDQGEVYIQGMKEDGFNVNFYDLSKFKKNGSYGFDTDLGGSTTVDEQLTKVEDAQGTISSIDDIYQTRVSNLESQQAATESQALLLEQVAASQRSAGSSDLDSLLLEYILRNSGKLFDGST